MNEQVPSRPMRRPVRAVVQVAGFSIGIALLIWCIRTALRPEKRAQIEHLRDASVWEIGALLSLTALSLTLNGLSFWATLRPVKRVPVGAMLATNALATFLNYLPFKVGAIVRVAIHNRRDRVPMLTIGAWFVAMTVLISATITPLIMASFWRRGVDWMWWLASMGGIVACGAVVIAAAKLLAGEAGLARIDRFVAGLKIAWPRRAIASHRFKHLHTGLAILADARMSALAMALRLAELGLQSVRFVLVAHIIHEPLAWSSAVLAASTYFVIGVLSPSGMLGAREGGTAAIVSVPASATLLVGASEIVVNLVAALVAIVALRPDRLLRPTDAAKGELGLEE